MLQPVWWMAVVFYAVFSVVICTSFNYKIYQLGYNRHAGVNFNGLVHDISSVSRVLQKSITSPFRRWHVYRHRASSRYLIPSRSNTVSFLVYSTVTPRYKVLACKAVLLVFQNMISRYGLASSPVAVRPGICQDAHRTEFVPRQSRWKGAQL